MPDVETLGGEGVGLHLNIGSRDLVDEAGLANIWKTWESTTVNTKMTDQPYIARKLVISDRIM